jgi:hypothetical protein
MPRFAEAFQDAVLSDITDQDERSRTLKIFKKIAPTFDDWVTETVSGQVEGELERRGYKQRSRMRDHDIRFQNLLACWRNNGYLPGAPNDRVEYKDLAIRDRQRMQDYREGKLKPEDFAFRDGAFYWDNPFLIPRVISTIVREPMEPVSVLTGLLTKIRFDNPTTSVLIPAVSAYAAGPLDMAEGDPYPEGQFEHAGTVTATIGKAGISVRFTEETLRYSLYDVMSMHLRAAGVALARWKEQKCANHILDQGVTSFDNSAAYGVTAHSTGRDSAGLFNGTFALQDLHTMYAEMINDGFRPNTLLMNPMAWTMFAQDPVMRSWAYSQGPKQIWQTVRGDVASMQRWANKGQTNGLNNVTFVQDPEQLMTTNIPVPDIFPYPLRLVISPFIPFDGTASTTDLILCDSSEIGILSVNEEPVTDQWEDPERDITKVKIRERYAINIMNDGRGLRVARNVIVGRAYNFEDSLQWQAGTGALPTGESTELQALQA